MEEEGRLSPFEAAALAWYHRNFLPIVVEAGILGQRLSRLELESETEDLFLMALNMIRQMDLKLQTLDARK